MPKKNKFRIKENEKPKSEINEKTEPKQDGQEGMMINFSCPLSFYSCKIGQEYTNYLKSPNDFIKVRRKLFGEALTYFQRTTIDKLASNSKKTHTHLITGDKLELVGKILRELVKAKWPQNDIETIVANYMSGDVWQVGYTNGLRLIGSRNNNIFNLLFIDYHHLIEPDDNYNNPDFYKYKYCPMSSDYCCNCKK